MCCQKVFCGSCLDRWLQTSINCSQCQAQLIDRDGSTGGCGEQRVKKLDRNAGGVQAVLWRVYGNLRIKCAHDCAWTGNIQMYAEHLTNCHAATVRAAVPQALPQQVDSAALELPDGVNKTCSVVWEHRATDASQLSLRVGDCVRVRQVTDHGWVYGRLMDGSPVDGGANEGWFPSFCLSEKA